MAGSGSGARRTLGLQIVEIAIPVLDVLDLVGSSVAHIPSHDHMVYSEATRFALGNGVISNVLERNEFRASKGAIGRDEDFAICVDNPVCQGFCTKASKLWCLDM